MQTDAFSKRHPLVNFVFFLGAIGCGVLIQHPAYTLVSLILGCVYYSLLHGSRGSRFLLLMIPVFLLLTAINPLFNIYGTRVLFSVFGRPYTVEALFYGAENAGILVLMLVWFGCYNTVLTSDKFTCLFGNLIPALSLLLVMVLRMIPNLMRKGKQFLGARMSIGKGAGESASSKEKILDGITVLSALTDWALEGSIVTGDSMRSRGYGSARRTSFMIYRMTLPDWLLLVFQPVLLLVVAATAIKGGMAATYTPELSITPVSGAYVPGILAYGCYLLIPTAIHMKEAIQWHISRSRI